MATHTNDSVHYDLALPKATRTTLERIADDRQIGMEDVFRRAVPLFVEADKARKAGRTLGVLDRDKQPVAELVGF